MPQQSSEDESTQLKLCCGTCTLLPIFPARKLGGFWENAVAGFEFPFSLSRVESRSRCQARSSNLGKPYKLRIGRYHRLNLPNDPLFSFDQLSVSGDLGIEIVLLTREIGFEAIGASSFRDIYLT